MRECINRYYNVTEFAMPAGGVDATRWLCAMLHEYELLLEMVDGRWTSQIGKHRSVFALVSHPGIDASADRHVQR